MCDYESVFFEYECVFASAHVFASGCVSVCEWVCMCVCEWVCMSRGDPKNLGPARRATRVSSRPRRVPPYAPNALLVALVYYSSSSKLHANM